MKRHIVTEEQLVRLVHAAMDFCTEEKDKLDETFLELKQIEVPDWATLFAGQDQTLISKSNPHGINRVECIAK